MAMFTQDTGRRTLPPLPRDRWVPPSALGRRCGISYASSSNYYTQPRTQRRGGISFECGDQSAAYVRMLGDMKMRSRQDYRPERRRASLPDIDLKLLDKLSQKETRLKFSSRFLSLHKRRWHLRPAVKIAAEHAALLDTQYGGQAQCMLSHADEWSFNVFVLDTLTNGRPLLHLALHLFHEYGLIEKFHLDVIKLMTTFRLIEDGYHGNNPYHNAVHATDVTQAMHCYLQESKLLKTVTPLEVMVSLIAAMAHDIDHPGVNQAFLIATANHLAALYDNSSVLENHHWRSVVGILNETKVFGHLDRHIRESIEDQLKSFILATDITKQQDFLNRFKKCIVSDDFDYVNNSDHRHFLLQIALKCADISNPCRVWDVSKQWSEKVCEEFFRQGDYERILRVPVTPLCDRFSTTVAKIQAGFLDFVVGPLFSAWYDFIQSKTAKHILDNVHINTSQWKELIQKDEKCLDAENDSEDTDCEVSSDIFATANEDSYEDIHSELSDTVEESRLPLTFGSYEDEEEFLCYAGGRRGSGRSLPRVHEVAENFTFFNQRRHSFPHLCIRRDITHVTVHRDTVLRTQFNRRSSLPSTMIHQATSLDKLTDRLSMFTPDCFIRSKKSVSMEELMTRPKVSNLSPCYEASKLASGYFTFSEPGYFASQSGKRKSGGSSHSGSKILLNSNSNSCNCLNSENCDPNVNKSETGSFEKLAVTECKRDVTVGGKQALLSFRQGQNCLNNLLNHNSKPNARRDKPTYTSFSCNNSKQTDCHMEENDGNCLASSALDKLSSSRNISMDRGFPPHSADRVLNLPKNTAQTTGLS